MKGWIGVTDNECFVLPSRQQGIDEAILRRDALQLFNNSLVCRRRGHRFGTKAIAKLSSGKDLAIEVRLSTEVDPSAGKNLETELRQMLQDVGLTAKVRIG